MANRGNERRPAVGTGGDDDAGDVGDGGAVVAVVRFVGLAGGQRCPGWNQNPAGDDGGG